MGLVSQISIRATQVETEQVLNRTIGLGALPRDRVACSVFLSMASYSILESYQPSKLKAVAGQSLFSVHRHSPC